MASQLAFLGSGALGKVTSCIHLSSLITQTFADSILAYQQEFGAEWAA
jgi:hypothetical protein